MLISSKQCKLNDDMLNIHINNVKLENVTHTTYIGTVVDKHLQWYSHVNHLCKKVSPKLYLLRHLSKFLPKSLLNKIYSSCIQPHLDYTCTVWGNSNKNNIHQVQRLQNTAARIIHKNYDYINVRGLDLVKNLGWQTFTERVDYLTASLMFKSIHGKAPFYLQDNIDMMCDVISYNSRSKYTMDVMVPSYNKEQFKSSFKYNGAVTWNKLPNEVKESTSIYAFKKSYKKYVAKQ